MRGENGSMSQDNHDPCWVQLNRGVHNGLYWASSEWICASLYILPVTELASYCAEKGWLANNGKTAVRANRKTSPFVVLCGDWKIFIHQQLSYDDFLTSLGNSTRPSALLAIVTSVPSSDLQQNRLRVQYPQELFRLYFSGKFDRSTQPIILYIDHSNIENEPIMGPPDQRNLLKHAFYIYIKPYTR